MRRGSLVRLVATRLAAALPALFAVIVVTFLLMRALPGDPAVYFAGLSATKEAIEQIRHKLGLDRSLPEQFVLYLRDPRGDLGQSITTGQTVAFEIATRLPASLELTLFALVLALAVALPLGVLAATRPGSWIDHLSRVLTTAGVSLPTFFTGLLLIYVFYYLLGWAPAPLGRLDSVWSPPPRVSGLFTVDSLLARDGPLLWACLKQLVLPAVTMALFVMAPIARMTRASMLGALGSDFIRTARASGLTRATVLYRYAFRNAMLPVVTTLGMVFSFMLGANVLVEKVFAWPGIGSYALDALVASDYAPVQGFVLTMASLYVLLNLLIDILYGLIDPRVDRGMTGALRHARYVIAENPVTLLAFGLLVLILLAALLGPSIAPYDPLTTNTVRKLEPPSRAHWFGTDQLGRDILSRVLVATRLDLAIAVGAVSLSFLVGTATGACAGFFGRWVDRVVSRLTDTIMAFPLFVLAMAIVAALGNNIGNVVLATAIINLPFYARMARAEVNVRREAGYVEAARLSGNSALRALGFHVVPNALPPMMVQVSLNLGWAMLNAAGLSFIGLGVRPPTPEWGILVAEGASFILSGEWWIALFPGLALMLAVFCFNLLGDGLRDMIDPRRRT